MNLQEFEALANQAWKQIPQEYKQGVDGLVVDKDAHTHPEHEDFFTMGECVTEAYPSDYGGPDTIRSAVVLYYGSFRAVAHDDPEFDWEREVNETLLHELQHHLEHLADDESLTDLDYAVEENYKRVDGQPFDPLFYRAGEKSDDALYRVEEDVFAEVETRELERIEHTFAWLGGRWRVAIPASAADILYAVIDQEMPEVRGDFCIVRIRRKGLFGTLRAALGSSGYSVEEVFVTAIPL